jgi:hypothetical protein
MARQGNGGSPPLLRSGMLSGVRGIAVLVLLVGATLASVADAKPSDRALVRAAFGAFVGAVGERDAERGIDALSEASLLEWQRDRLLALEGEKEVVSALPPGRRLVVLALRHAAPRFLATDGSPEELARHALRAGMADREGLARIEIGDVDVQGVRASATLYAAGLPSGFRAGFVRERGAWRLDLPATLDAAGRVIAHAAKASDSSEDAVIAGLLYAASGRRPTSQIWQPLAPSASPSASP